MVRTVSVAAMNERVVVELIAANEVRYEPRGEMGGIWAGSAF